MTNMETPPPFKPRDAVTAQQVQEVNGQGLESGPPAPAAAPELTRLGLDDEMLLRVQEMLRDAEAEGYLRGRNEKIEATQHFDVLSEPEPSSSPSPTGIPEYRRTSIWD